MTMITGLEKTVLVVTSVRLQGPGAWFDGYYKSETKPAAWARFRQTSGLHFQPPDSLPPKKGEKLLGPPVESLSEKEVLLQFGLQAAVTRSARICDPQLDFAPLPDGLTMATLSLVLVPPVFSYESNEGILPSVRVDLPRLLNWELNYLLKEQLELCQFLVDKKLDEDGNIYVRIASAEPSDWMGMARGLAYLRKKAGYDEGTTPQSAHGQVLDHILHQMRAGGIEVVVVEWNEKWLELKIELRGGDPSKPAVGWLKDYFHQQGFETDFNNSVLNPNLRLFVRADSARAELLHDRYALLQWQVQKLDRLVLEPESV